VIPLVGMLLVVLQCHAAAPYDSIRAIRVLSTSELSRRDPVRFEGVVFGMIPRTGRLMVQEDGKGLILIPPDKDSLPPLGARISVEGNTEPQGTTMVKATRITVLDANAGRPEPERLKIGEVLAREPLNGGFVELSGLIVSARTNAPDARPFLRNRVLLGLKQDGRTLNVLAPVPYQQAPPRLVMARVRARGQLVDVQVSPGADAERFLWVPQWREIIFEEAGPTDPFQQPVYPIKQILSEDQPAGDAPVRVRGRVYERTGPNQLLIGFLPTPRPPQFMARHEQPLPIQPGDVVDLLGFPKVAEDGSRFDIIDARRLELPRGVAVEDVPGTSLAVYLPVIDSKVAIGQLSDEQVERGWPARLSGVVSHRDESRGFFLSAGRAGYRHPDCLAGNERHARAAAKGGGVGTHLAGHSRAGVGGRGFRAAGRGAGSEGAHGGLAGFRGRTFHRFVGDVVRRRAFH